MVEGPSSCAAHWVALRGCIKGRSHCLCQDYCDVRPDEGGEIVAAVADGHGGQRYLRSHRGAELAVDVAIALGERILEESHGGDLRLVKEKIEGNPLSPEEQERLASPAPLTTEEKVILYGTTLLLVLAAPRFVACLQIGDGDILELQADGSVSRPIPRDPTLIANETTSLASLKPRLARYSFQEFETQSAAPSLVLLATDGYSNSFVDDAAFRQVAADYVGHLGLEDGVAKVRKDIQAWLQETSDQGSGDDLSVVLLFRPAALAASPGGEEGTTEVARDQPPPVELPNGGSGP
jgi:serine/threonine protein phosphatase PrpC